MSFFAALALLPALAAAAPPAGGTEEAAPPAFDAGFGKADVTPTRPLRLAGYADRGAPFEGIDSPLFARAVAIRSRGLAGGGTGEPAGANGPTFVLASLDSMGLPAAFGREIAARVAEAHGVPRARFALCVTHTHSAPHLETGGPSLFATPLTDAERTHSAAHTRAVADGVLQAVGAAIADLRPARLTAGTGEVGFAVNRRRLRNGKWVGFGVQPDAPVDHTLPVLRIAGADGAVRGVLFNYACHATTLTGGTNRVTGDWPGLACAQIEAAHPGAVALCTIGTGADANPHPRGRTEHALSHAKAVAAEVATVLARPMRPVTTAPTAAYGTAPLPFDPYPPEALARMRDDGDRFERQYAAIQFARREDGPPPAEYAASVQVWRFGDDLTMIFLGGEVVVDYGLRIKRELAPSAGGGPVWVTAYANDMFAYVPSDRLLAEGGYEAAGAMVFYLHPGPFQTGTEAILIERVKELTAEARADDGGANASSAASPAGLPPRIPPAPTPRRRGRQSRIRSRRRRLSPRSARRRSGRTAVSDRRSSPAAPACPGRPAAVDRR